MLSVFIIGIAAIAVFAIFPTFRRAQVISADESKAVLMAQRMVEHLQLLKPNDLTASTLEGLNLIDGEQQELPYSFSHVPLDEATGYSPAKALKNGTAEMDIEDIGAGSKRVILTMRWTSASGKTRILTMGTILGGYK
jgi:hypothetical protein